MVRSLADRTPFINQGGLDKHTRQARFCDECNVARHKDDPVEKGPEDKLDEVLCALRPYERGRLDP